MLLEISEILSPLTDDPIIKVTALYRIDGVPIFAKVSERSGRILNLLYWLENQIKSSLYYIFTKMLDEISFTYYNTEIRMFAVSRTLVLVLMIESEDCSSRYKLDIDVENVINCLRELVEWRD
jgi:hypothetical protein